ncbi:MAG: alpha/beta hydrolase [Jaaginema sp. PMC 1079.18]|nr:alpha/beta hydrolase [Jaaginema sp. PMC 1080.18]MEC4852481.1 alpha/beta hydrolase [Jaaginema sp. PMC 1079.18]MEC4868632.1 alpha/beta hydrolase [Jaaginema sp. PMC 1078.18]
MNQALSFLKPAPPRPHNPLWIYFPGMDGTGELFATQLNSLAPAFDIRCLAIDPDNLQGWDDLTAAAVNLIAAEVKNSPNRPVYLCGESFGGCLAMKVAVTAPHLISQLVLCNPASSFVQRPFFKLAIPMLNYIPDLVHRGSALALLPFLASLGRISQGDRRALLDAMKSVSARVVSWRLALLRDFYLQDRAFQKFDKPVLILAGAQDRLLPSVAEAKLLAQKFPQGRSAVLPASGHACLLETEIKLLEILQAENFWPKNSSLAAALNN